MKQDCTKLKVLEEYAYSNKVKQFGPKDISILLLVVPGTESFFKKNSKLSPELFSEKLNDHVVNWIIKTSKKCKL